MSRISVEIFAGREGVVGSRPLISVENDGGGVPVLFHEKEGNSLRGKKGGNV